MLSSMSSMLFAYFAHVVSWSLVFLAGGSPPEQEQCGTMTRTMWRLVGGKKLKWVPWFSGSCGGLFAGRDKNYVALSGWEKTKMGALIFGLLTSRVSVWRQRQWLLRMMMTVMMVKALVPPQKKTRTCAAAKNQAKNSTVCGAWQNDT